MIKGGSKALVIYTDQVQHFTVESDRGPLLTQHTNPLSSAAQFVTTVTFDDLSNGFSDPDRRKADQKFFEEVEHIAPDGLGLLYNAQSCRECHQTPVSGAASQVTQLRVGHIDAHRQFQNPQIPINHGSEVIQDRTLVNDRAICPEIQERVPETETVRTTRLATNTLGDGYVEAISDETLLKIRKQQCQALHGKICGQAVKVPVPQSEGHDRIGRFGWKDQHASLTRSSSSRRGTERPRLVAVAPRVRPKKFIAPDSAALANSTFVATWPLPSSSQKCRFIQEVGCDMPRHDLELHVELIRLLEKQTDLTDLATYVRLTDDEVSEYAKRQERISELLAELSTLKGVA
jgi:hypothetical protein